MSGCAADEPTRQASAGASATPAAVLADLRARFVLKTSRPGDFEGAPTAVSTPVLGPSEVDHFDGASGALAPSLRVAGAKARGKLPAKADGASTLTDAASGLTVSIAPRGFSSSVMQVIDGYTLGIGAGPGASTVVATATSEGIEDWVVFGAAPSESSLTYEVTLGAGVAGVRLVERTLEILDAKGTPRLRMRPPLLVDAKGAAHPVDVRLEGCAFDASPVPPWGRAVTAPGSGSCVVALSWASASPAYPIAVDPSWTSTGSLAYGRGQHTGSRLADGRVLAVGGYAPVTPACELYDPSTGTWAVTGNNLTPRFSHAAAVLDDGRVLVAGGYRTSDWALQQTAEVYSPSTGTWSSVASMSTTRENFSLTALSTGKVLAAAGYAGGSSFRRTAELFDPVAGTWSGTGLLSVARAAHAASLLPNGKVLVTGGQNTSYLASAEVWDPATNAWSSAGTMSTVRSWHAQVTMPYGGKVLVAGGHVDGTYTTPSVQLYDIATNAWSSAPSMTTGRAKFGAALLPNAQVLLAAGQTQWNVFTASADAFGDYPRTTKAAASLGQSRSNFALVPLASGKVLAVAGYSGNQYLAASELYDSSGPISPGTQEHESLDPPPLVAAWADENKKGTLAIGTALQASVTNNTDAARSVFVDLTAVGLDQRTVTRQAVANVTIPAGQSTSVTLYASDFPIRPVGSEAALILQIRPHSSGVPNGQVLSAETPLFYETDAAYTQVILHGMEGRDLDRTQPAQSVTVGQWLTSTQSTRAGLGSLAGQVWTPSGGFVALGSLPPTADGRLKGVYRSNGQWAKDFSSLFPAFVLAGYTPPQGAKFYKLCANWKADFDDVAGGEDVLAVPGIQQTPARYSKAVVLGPGDSTVWVGKLDDGGCTDALQLGDGEAFQLVWESELERNTTTMRVSYGPMSLCIQGQGCSTYIFPDAPLVSFDAVQIKSPGDGGSTAGAAVAYPAVSVGSTDWITRTAAVFAEAVRGTDTGLQPATLYAAYANVGCFADSQGRMGEACGTNPMKLGRSFVFDGNGSAFATGRHTTYSKFTIGHEFGHVVMGQLMGPPRSRFPCNGSSCQENDTNLGRTAEFSCRCDFVSSGNRFHCLQSKEIQGAAQSEGWAHFYAAKLFNDPAQNDCKFVYYKNQLDMTTYSWPVPTYPGRPVDCFYGLSQPQKWMSTYCPGARAKKGVEWDWMTFFYELHSKGAQAFSTAELNQVYRTACNNSTAQPCADTSVYFDESALSQPNAAQMSLEAAVEQVWGSTSQKALYFRSTGAKHGVKNQ